MQKSRRDTLAALRILRDAVHCRTEEGDREVSVW